MIQIENKPVTDKKKHMIDFLFAVRDLEINQSFVVKAIPSDYRQALSTAGVLMNKKFSTVKEKDGYRVGRIR